MTFFDLKNKEEIIEKIYNENPITLYSNIIDNLILDKRICLEKPCSITDMNILKKIIFDEQCTIKEKIIYLQLFLHFSIPFIQKESTEKQLKNENEKLIKIEKSNKEFIEKLNNDQRDLQMEITKMEKTNYDA